MSDTTHPLHNELASIVDGENVIDDVDKLRSSYSQDKSPFAQIMPGIVVRPGSVEQIAEVLKIANRAAVPVTARGGGFSLTGYLQSAESIVIDTKRMNRVVEIDEVNLTVTAECGIIMKDLHDACAERGYYVHTVGIPIAYTTLGGVLSGVQGGGYPVTMSVSGTDLHYLLGLKVVLPHGTILDTNAGGANIHRDTDFMRGANAPDLTGMFVGDGGCFGIKAQATLQIFPRPSSLGAGCWDFASFDNLWRVMLRLTSLDTLPYENISVLEAHPLSLFYLTRADDQARADELCRVIDQVCDECGGLLASEDMQQYAIDIGVGDPDYQDIFVNVHRGLLAFMCAKRAFPDTYRKVKKFLEAEIESKGLDELGVNLMIYFSPVARNAVYTTMSIVFDEETEGAREATLALQKEGHRLVVELGASPEPHQGFASQVNAQSWSPAYRELMTNLKKVFDPNNILNPGLWGL